MMITILLSIATILSAVHSCAAFAPTHVHVGQVMSSSAGTPLSRSSAPLQASRVDVMDLALNNVGSGADALVGMVTSSSIILSETEPWVQPLSLVLGPSLNFFSFAMVRFAAYIHIYVSICLFTFCFITFCIN